MSGWRAPAGLVLVLAAVFVAGLTLGRMLLPPEGSTAEPHPATPVSLSIPSIEVDAPVHAVGLAADGSIDAPPLSRSHEVGWYADGPLPGQHGAAVLVGHVDDRNGPAVFHDVPRLRPGDEIEVVRHDGGRARFEVTAVRSYHKSRLPDEVYGDFTARELRLITCGGQWLGGRIGYEDNVVVFARLVDPA